MPPKKNKGSAGDGKAASSVASHSKSASVETQADKQLWAALRQEDETALQELLFDGVQDAELGGVRLVAKPSAKALVNRSNAKKLLPLCYAVEDRLPDSFIEALLDAGADVNKVQEAKGANAALHNACFAEEEALIRLLLARGANPTVQNGSGETPLHILAVSHNAHLVRAVLDSVRPPGSGGEEKEEEEGGDGGEERVPGSHAAAGAAAVHMSPLELLATRSTTDGGTALHVALENSLEATEAMLTCVEAAPKNTPAVSDLLSATTTGTNNDTLLHLVASLTQVTPNVPAVARVWERLVQLGASPTALNKEGQTPFMALLDKGELAAFRPEDVRRLLDAAAHAAKAEGGDAAVDQIMAQLDARGLAVVHVAIARRHTAALNAIRSYVLDNASTMNVSETVTRWFGCPTRDGVRVVEMLAAQDAPADMLSLFDALGIIDKAEYVALREVRQADVAAQAQAEAEAAAEAETSSSEEEAPTTSAAVPAAQKAVGGGASRVQQARKARAVAAAAAGGGGSGGGRHAQKHGGKGGDATEHHDAGAGSKLSMSTPMMVLCGLLVLALVLMVYTSAVPPTIRGEDL